MKRVLLVMDDEVDICRLFRRMLAKSFDEIHLCQTQAEAEAVLEAHEVTHVVVDHYLGEGRPLGTQVLTAWRRRWPSILYGAVFSGSDLQMPALPPGVDAVFVKPAGFEPLAEALRR